VVDGEIRQLLTGGTTGVRHALPIVARSICTFEVPSDEDVIRCEMALTQFSGFLQKRPVEDTRYEWGKACRMGRQFELEILWYDVDYFHERRSAFLVGAHALALQRFGLKPQDLVVIHSN